MGEFSTGLLICDGSFQERKKPFEAADVKWNMHVQSHIPLCICNFVLK